MDGLCACKQILHLDITSGTQNLILNQNFEQEMICFYKPYKRLATRIFLFCSISVNMFGTVNFIVNLFSNVV